MGWDQGRLRRFEHALRTGGDFVTEMEGEFGTETRAVVKYISTALDVASRHRKVWSWVCFVGGVAVGSILAAIAYAVLS